MIRHQARTTPKPERRARCGEQRQAKGKTFRYYRRGVGYCDTCAPLKGSWLIGLGFYGRPVYETY